MSNLRDKFIDGEGYVILEKILPDSITYPTLQKFYASTMVRASTKNLAYAEKDGIKLLDDVAVWWSYNNLEDGVFKIIDIMLRPFIFEISNNLEFYSCDFVTINSNTEYCNPHVDTPHRFTNWNFDKRLLGVQCIVALEDMTVTNGVTGLVPYSQKRDFDIKDCYSGKYTRWFKENAVQFDLHKGSVLMYNCRVLHSSMNNNSDKARTALAINYLEHDLVDEVKSVDNIWNSYG